MSKGRKYTIKIRARDKVYEVSVKPILKLFGWDLAWVKVTRKHDVKDK